MKKIYFEGCRLFLGIEELYGDFLLETEGYPVTLNDLEEVGADDIIERIEKAVEETTPQELTEEDIEYVNGVLEAWGLKEE